MSGLAKGCDTAGHVGALRAHGITTAVLAHGLDSIYPKENRSLAENILSNDGLLISEYLVGQKPIGSFFVERDRIQAGLSDCVFVVETGIKGGTMHTVKYCLEYERILACLQHPQEMHNEIKVQGNRALIADQKGAPVFSVSDIKGLISMVRAYYGSSSRGNGCGEGINKATVNDEPHNEQLDLWD